MFVNGVTIEMQDFFHSTNFLSDVRITKMSILVQASRMLSSKCPLSLVRQNSTSAKKQTIFFDPEVQRILRGLTGLEFQKVFRLRKLGNKPQRPIYQASVYE